MKASFGYQYFDFDPDEIKKQEGHIDLKKAVDLFSTFPWDEQFDKVLKREESGLSSTTPALYFYETKENFLSISALDVEGFFIEYRHANRLGEFFISNNILEKPEGISVEQFIDDFFNHRVEQTLELIEVEHKSKEVIDIKLNYNKVKLYRPLLYSLLPFLNLIFYNYEPREIFPIILIMSGIIFIVTLPNLLLNLKYWKNDSNQVISYDPALKIVTLKRNGKTSEILKSEIEYVDFVHPRLSQKAFSDYSYLRISTKHDAFVVTHLTIHPLELLQILNMNFKDMEVYYPKLKLAFETEKEKKRRKHFYEQKRSEFLQTYSDWESDKLEEVIFKTDHYADYARSAATEILEKRKAVNKTYE